MRLLWDERRIDQLEQRFDRLEKKVDVGFAEARADYRLLIGILLTMFITMILGFAGIILGHLS
jgi:hypothetical protein